MKTFGQTVTGDNFGPVFDQDIYSALDKARAGDFTDANQLISDMMNNTRAYATVQLEYLKTELAKIGTGPALPITLEKALLYGAIGWVAYKILARR